MRRAGVAASVAVVLVFAATAHAQAQDAEPADLLLHNGKVFTADALLSTYTAVAVRDGRIVALGWDDLARRFDAERTVDLAGRLVLPGFIDTHVHVSGDAQRWVDLAGLENIPELKARVTRKAEQLGAGEWITGYGWSEDELAEQRRPLRWDLDDAAPANPVVLTRAGGHSSVASSLALEAAAVTPDTETPPGGIIEVDDENRMNGILREGAQGLVRRLVPDATPEEIRASFVENLRGLLGLGITSIIQAGVDIEGYAEWETVYEAHAGELPRAAVQFRVPPDPARAIDMLRRFDRKTGDGDEWLRVGAVKFFVDGGFSGAAAWTLEPYKGQPDYYGSGPLIDEAGLFEISRTAHDMGWQLGLPRHRRRCNPPDDRRLVAHARGVAARRPPPLPEPLHRDAAGRNDAADGGLEHPHRAASPTSPSPSTGATPSTSPASATRRTTRCGRRCGTASWSRSAATSCRSGRWSACRPRSPAGAWAARWSDPVKR